MPATRHAAFRERGAGRHDLSAVRARIPEQRFLFRPVPFARPRQRSRHGRSDSSHCARSRSRPPDPFVETFAQHLDSNFELWIVRAGAALFTIFGGLALGLAAVGLYGVKAYSVARRTREIGIRMALGAQRGAVLRMIMREGSVMLLSGLVLGLLLAAATGKLLSGILSKSARSIRRVHECFRCSRSGHVTRDLAAGATRNSHQSDGRAAHRIVRHQGGNRLTFPAFCGPRDKSRNHYAMRNYLAAILVSVRFRFGPGSA